MLDLAQRSDLILDGILLVTLGCAVVTDLRTRRISNRLTYPAAALGLAVLAAAGGWGGLSALAGTRIRRGGRSPPTRGPGGAGSPRPRPRKRSAVRRPPDARPIPRAPAYTTPEPR